MTDRLVHCCLLVFGIASIMLLSNAGVRAQCQYDGLGQAFPGLNANDARTPEIGMTPNQKISVSQDCDRLVKSLLKSVARPTSGLIPVCEEVGIRPGAINRPALRAEDFSRYYQPFRHPKSIDRDLASVNRWYRLFDCPTRQAIRILEKKGLRLPDGLLIYRLPRPSRTFQSPNPAVITRTGAFDDTAQIFFMEWNDRDWAEYDQANGFHGVILSAIGQILHERSAGEFYYGLGGTRPQSGSEVSPRAARSAHLFVADVFAGLMLNRTYSRAVMDEYRSFRGPRLRLIGRGRSTE